MRWRVILERKFSTAYRRDAEVGVKWEVQRGPRRSSGRLAFAEGVGTRAAVRYGPVAQPRPSDRLLERADQNERLRPAALARRSGLLHPARRGRNVSAPGRMVLQL